MNTVEDIPSNMGDRVDAQESAHACGIAGQSVAQVDGRKDNEVSAPVYVGGDYLWGSPEPACC